MFWKRWGAYYIKNTPKIEFLRVSSCRCHAVEYGAGGYIAYSRSLEFNTCSVNHVLDGFKSTQMIIACEFDIKNMNQSYNVMRHYCSSIDAFISNGTIKYLLQTNLKDFGNKEFTISFQRGDIIDTPTKISYVTVCHCRGYYWANTLCCNIEFDNLVFCDCNHSSAFMVYDTSRLVIVNCIYPSDDSNWLVNPSAAYFSTDNIQSGADGECVVPFKFRGERTFFHTVHLMPRKINKIFSRATIILLLK